MGHDHYKPSGKITLSHDIRSRGNSETEMMNILSVKDEKTLVLDVIDRFDNAYKSYRSTDNSEVYEIGINKLIELIINHGTKINV